MAQFQAKDAKVIEMDASVPHKRKTTVSNHGNVYFLIFFRKWPEAQIRIFAALSVLGGISIKPPHL